VRPTQPVEIFGNVSTSLVVYLSHPLNSMQNFTEIVPGKPLNLAWLLKTQAGEPHIAILDLSKAISRKRCTIGGKLVLMTNRKFHISFRLLPKLVTLNDPEWHNGHYFALFHRIRKLSGQIA